MSIFNKILFNLSEINPSDGRLMLDATHLKAHRTTANRLKKAFSHSIGRRKSGLNSKLHAVCDGSGRPVSLLLTEGHVSDYKGVALLLHALTDAKEVLADRGHDATWFRKALLEKGITPCIPSKLNRKEPVIYDKELYKQHRYILHWGKQERAEVFSALHRFRCYPFRSWRFCRRVPPARFVLFSPGPP